MQKSGSDIFLAKKKPIHGWEWEDGEICDYTEWLEGKREVLLEILA